MKINREFEKNKYKEVIIMRDKISDCINLLTDEIIKQEINKSSIYIIQGLEIAKNILINFGGETPNRQY